MNYSILKNVQQEKFRHYFKINIIVRLILFIVLTLSFPIIGSAQCNLVINQPEEVCTPNTVDLTASAITAGSSSGITITYWTDNDTTKQLSNPSAISVSGTYYIKAQGTDGCTIVKPVTVVIVKGPYLEITDPFVVCMGETIDLTDTTWTSGSDPGLVLTYWLDSSVTIPISNPAAIDTSGTYFIKGDAISGCSAILPVEAIITDDPTLVINDPSPVCYPEVVDITSAAITAGSDPGLTLSYWINASATAKLPSPEAIRYSGTYYIKGVAKGGCLDMRPVNVIISTSPSLVVNDPEPVCGENYVDLTRPEVTAGSETGLVFTYWIDSLATDLLPTPDSVTNIGTYYIKASYEYGCSTVEPVNIVKVSVENPDVLLSIVTVDSSMVKNKIIWNISNGISIRQLNIYREGEQTDNYILIDTLVDFSAGEYIDITSEPQVNAELYKISIVDTCGSESPLSAFHKTIHLIASAGSNNSVNLIWNAYQGREIDHYLIHRNSEEDASEIVGVVSGNILSFSDLNAPQTRLTYLIEAIPKDSDETDYITSLSNEVTIGSTALNIYALEKQIKVFPVPFNDFLVIEFPNETSHDGVVEIRNILGKVVHQWKSSDSRIRINTSGMPEGTYLLNFIGDYPFKKIIVK